MNQNVPHWNFNGGDKFGTLALAYDIDTGKPLLVYNSDKPDVAIEKEDVIRKIAGEYPKAAKQVTTYKETIKQLEAKMETAKTQLEGAEQCKQLLENSLVEAHAESGIEGIANEEKWKRVYGMDK